ncbi:hypothetical protein GQ457_04G023530 [Hibiscus cannabinus]
MVLKYGFVQSPSDHSLFVKGTRDDFIALIVYVDDTILAGKNLSSLQSVQAFLKNHFKVKELGELKFFLGLEIVRNSIDYIICLDTRRSTIDYFLYIGSRLVSWKFKKQTTANRFSCEAEYRAMASITCELVWLATFLSSFHIIVHYVSLYCGNHSAIHLAFSQVFYEMIKHIEVDCHFVRKFFFYGFLKLLHVRFANELADIFTKALHFLAFHSFVIKMSLLNIHQVPA